MGTVGYGRKAVEMNNITKMFGNFCALNNVSLSVDKGEVHALLGENGAGKSTLMNILYGLHRPSKGDIFIHGLKTEIKNPNAAIKSGIGMVHQHFMLVEPFTVTENIILGNETTFRGGVVNMEKARDDIAKISEKYGLRVDPNARVEDISVSMQQKVEILKALYRGVDILILDEPTAVLTPQEICDLIGIIRNLVREGKTIIIITHKLKEIKQMADNCTIIRRGKNIDTVIVGEIKEQELASKMVGRDVLFTINRSDQEKGKSVFKINQLKVKDNRGIDAVKDLSLEVHEGEILGIAGIDGNGQAELVEAITGLRRVSSGTVEIGGKDVTNKKPKEIFESGIAMIPEDRQKRGLVLDFTVAENMVLENYVKKPFSRRGLLNLKYIDEFAKDLINKFDVRPQNHTSRARALSGGNQQKVIIAREVTNDPKLLIAVQPTRGLDVGAIEYVHKALIELREKNKGVLLVSLELDEIMSVSDRIAVIYEGRIVKIINAREANENMIGLWMAGGSDNK